MAVSCAGAVLAGCIGGPTYGTGTPAGRQLLEDVSNMASFERGDGEPIAYSPRPDLVTPGSTEILPPPQERIASASNPQWPESPEERRRRIRAEGEANADNPQFRSPLRSSDERGVDPETLRARSMASDVNASINDPVRQREQFNERLRQSRQGDARQRQFLSEPPTEYRVPADSAPADDVGVDEWKKERDAKRAARKDDGRTGWRDLVPWL